MKKDDAKLYFDESRGPLGNLLLVTSERGIRAAIWNCDSRDSKDSWLRFSGPLKKSPSHPVLLSAKKELSEYFAGKRTAFDLPLDPQGTPFQLRAWRALRQIPYGKTISYSEQALRLGGPNYARAAGSANRVNPIAIIVPCHRVIGKNGDLTGFLYGTDAKSFLLELERGTLSIL